MPTDGNGEDGFHLECILGDDVGLFSAAFPEQTRELKKEMRFG